ncbi:hypothetical protein CMU90_18445 [Elizabethkingia anophelis]|nr:hypothetical protein [Elizabethkingia anophelis]
MIDTDGEIMATINAVLINSKRDNYDNNNAAFHILTLYFSIELDFNQFKYINVHNRVATY